MLLNVVYTIILEAQFVHVTIDKTHNAVRTLNAVLHDADTYLVLKARASMIMVHRSTTEIKKQHCTIYLPGPVSHLLRPPLCCAALRTA